ncbi:ABC transporter substrate-binding protein [Chitinimonas lacunae]|uniref:ABC transporter substrate-binding protein n=1 Tax=Chitinimonas lacunae TaxID=1963018 RepID=A0ABV8MXW3_9NEIS
MKLTKLKRVLGIALALPLAAISVEALAAADMNKVLRYYFEAPESGFDPAKYSDHYSGEINSSIFESLLDYDYLAEPMTLVPNTAEALPTVLDEGKTFIYKIRPGIFFADDPAFGGKKRELVAQDYVYSYQRLVDPANRGAPWDFMLKGKIVGLDEKLEEAKKTGKFDYDKPIEGLKALDRYTLQIKLKRPDYNMMYITAAVATGAVAREVITKYGEDSEAHPVGTGPYRVKSWQRRNRIILEANPNYRGKTYTPTTAPGAEVDQRLVKELAGKTFPRIGIIDIKVINQPQAAWLAFESKEIDMLPRMGASYGNLVAKNGVLKPEYVKRGYQYMRESEAYIGYYQFNMDDPVVGGYELPKIALRRAIALSYDQAKSIAVVRLNQATAAQSPLAPQINGYDPNFKNVLGRHSPAHGNAMLDLFGYKDCDNDGWREQPGCKPLKISFMMSSGKDSRATEELLQKGFDSIKIRFEVVKMNFSDMLKNRQNGQYQMAEGAWGQDYPDAENFMQLLYGPNAGPVNEARFRNKDFDKLYEDIATSPPSPERNEKLRQMSRIVAAYVPWIYDNNLLRSHLAHSWMRGFRVHPINMPYFMYLDIDEEQRKASMQKK